jgi:hypothetical protein
MSTRVDHRVDGRPATRYAAGREPDAPTAKPGLRHRVFVPAKCSRTPQPLPKSKQRDVENATILTASFEEQDALTVPRQSRGNDASGCPRADNYLVVLPLVRSHHEGDYTGALAARQARRSFGLTPRTRSRPNAGSRS